MARAHVGAVVSSVGHHQLARLLEGWAGSGGVLHVQLADRVRALVRSGALPAGTRLPSERSVARVLDVSRTTVTVAFDQLRGEALLSSRQGDGTYVSLAGEHLHARGDDRLRSFTSEPAGAELIDLRSAALGGLDLVAEEIGRLTRDEVGDLVATHGYLPGGLALLRDEVSCYYNDLGLPTTVDQVLITSGAQQALRLVAATLLEPGSAVLIEEPSFRGAIEVLRAAGARLVAVPSGRSGINLGLMAEAIRRHRPVFALVQSTVHNPTGSVLSEGARRAVGACGVPVVDDASMSDTLIDRPMPRPLAAAGGPVITIGSASKSFWGGLRVGWIRADPPTIAAMTAVKGLDDLGTSLVAQLVTARLLRRIDEARTIRAAQLAAARATALQTVSELFPTWRPRPPAGGASLWVRLPTPCATALAQRAQRHGVGVLPGPTFSCRDRLDDHLRIGLAAPDQLLVTGLRRLAMAWRHFA